MTEKEERIFIKKILPECKFRELHETTAGGHTWVDFICGKSSIKNLECDDKCFEQCEWKELTGISRQEAINRMAKAICLCDDDSGCKGICNPKCEVWKYSLNHAEAALNAILEDK